MERRAGDIQSFVNYGRKSVNVRTNRLSSVNCQFYAKHNCKKGYCQLEEKYKGSKFHSSWQDSLEKAASN
jgi:hypothetical protein